MQIGSYIFLLVLSIAKYSRDILFSFIIHTPYIPGGTVSYTTGIKGAALSKKGELI